MNQPCTPDALVASYRAARGADRERFGRLLLERYDKVLEAIIRDDAARAGVHVASREERAELRDELRMCLFEAVESYDADKTHADNGFDHWVRYCFHHRLATLAGGSSVVDLPESWQRVARIAARVDERLQQQLRRAPTFDELRAGVLAHASEWAKARITETGTDLDPAALERAVHDKLRKQGTLGAIERLADIQAFTGHAEQLDVGGVHDVAGDEDGGVVSSRIGAVWNDVERDIVERRLGAFDGREWTFEEIAAVVDLSWTDVRRVLHVALAKPKAPHAQFIYLAGIDTVVDSDRAQDPVDRFRQRSAARRRVATGG